MRINEAGESAEALKASDINYLGDDCLHERRVAAHAKTGGRGLLLSGDAQREAVIRCFHAVPGRRQLGTPW